MMKNTTYIIAFLLLLSACSGEEKKKQKEDTAPVVGNSGLTISFPEPESMAFFKTEKASIGDLTADFTAPANIAATVVPSREGAGQNIILFENPELTSQYTQLMQHQINVAQIRNINVKQKQLELERTKDLKLHGSATGQDLLNAETALSMEQTQLANEKASLVEHESKLISAGFPSDILRNAKAGTAYLIADIPETQVGQIEEGSTCKIKFHSFPEENYTGKIDGIAQVVDIGTRTVKVRVRVNDPSVKLKAGMFANVSYVLSKGNHISISKNALITVQGKNYVFVRKSANEFERVEIETGQQIGDRIIVFSGLTDNDEIAVEGVMQLKGLSFGY